MYLKIRFLYFVLTQALLLMNITIRIIVYCLFFPSYLQVGIVDQSINRTLGGSEETDLQSGREKR